MSKRTPAAKSTPEKDGCCGSDCCSGGGCCGVPATGCCEVVAVVGVDGRGQMVLPKAVRQQMGIRADDKLAVVLWKKGDTPCCLALMKVDELAESVRRTYGPLIGEIARS